MATVANTYFTVLAAQDEVRVTRQDLAAAERILTLIKSQFNGGTASQLDLSQQEALVATQRAAIPRSRSRCTRISQPSPCWSRARRQTSPFTVDRPPRSWCRGSPRDCLRNCSTRAAGHPPGRGALAASNFSVEAARAAFFPQIQLTGSTGFQSAALASLFTPGAWFYTLTAGLTQPIFDGFLLESQLKQAKGVQLQDLQAYRKAVLSAFADVEKALIGLQEFTLQERLQKDVVTASPPGL